MLQDECGGEAVWDDPRTTYVCHFNISSCLVLVTFATTSQIVETILVYYVVREYFLPRIYRHFVDFYVEKFCEWQSSKVVYLCLVNTIVGP